MCIVRALPASAATPRSLPFTSCNLKPGNFTIISHFTAQTSSHINMNSEKAVRFSPNVAIHTNSSFEEENKWYDEEDRARFNRSTIGDAIRCSRMISAKAAQNEPLSNDELTMLVGLDSLMTRQLVQHVAQMKRRHVGLVLREQEHQRFANDYREERLAHLAGMSSQWSRERSHNIARRYASFWILKDTLSTIYQSKVHVVRDVEKARWNRLWLWSSSTDWIGLTLINSKVMCTIPYHNAHKRMISRGSEKAVMEANLKRTVTCSFLRKLPMTPRENGMSRKQASFWDCRL